MDSKTPKGQLSGLSPTGNYAGFVASAPVKQEILGDVGSGDEVREGAGSGDRQNAGRIVNAPRAASAQSDSKKASKVSFAWKRRNGVPTGKTFANAFSFMARFACKYAFVVSMLSCQP
jgi:hypothetical protein